MARVQYVQFGDLPLQLIAERALFISMAKFARSLVTCHCSLVSCHCSLVSCHCSLVSCHCSLVSCHCSLVSCHCSLVSCHCSLINVSPRTTTTTTTKQNLDPRCTYVQTRVKIEVAFDLSWWRSCRSNSSSGQNSDHSVDPRAPSFFSCQSPARR
jgi:hypothetical protein